MGSAHRRSQFQKIAEAYVKSKTIQQSIFEAIRDWPVWLQLGLGLVLSSLGAYYGTEVLLVALGQPTMVLYDPMGLAITTGALMIIGFIGLLTRRPLIVGSLLSIVGVVFLMQFALRSTGNPIGWIRQTIGYLMPLVSRFLLSRWRNAVLALSGK